MPSWYSYGVIALFSMLALFLVGLIVREVRARLKAGPVRFRLPLASVARPPQAARAFTILLSVVVLLVLLPGLIRQADLSAWVLPVVFLWMILNSLQASITRRDERRWLVLASGLLPLALGAMLLVVGARSLQAGDALFLGTPTWFPLCWSFSLFVVGAVMIQEFASGTRVREGDIELFGATRPWSRVVIKGWQEREGGSALRLSIASPWRGEMPPGLDNELIVPVPASERPALEDFLAGRTATAG
jgi:hypothetical protein